MATLTAAITGADSVIQVSGDASAAVKGKTYAIDDEIIVLVDFLSYPNVVGGTSPGDYPDRSHWRIQRGAHGSTPASHALGAAIVAVLDGHVRSTSLSDPAPLKTLSGSVVIEIDGGGSAVTTGVKGELRLPFAGSWVKVTVLADQSATASVDLWLDSLANFPPTDADSITASAVPSLAAATSSEDSDLTGWTTAFVAGDCLRWNVDANDNATRLTVILDYERTI